MSTRRSRAEGLAGVSVQIASLWRGFFYAGVTERGQGYNPKRGREEFRDLRDKEGFRG
jgi:hypothetical protein